MILQRLHRYDREADIKTASAGSVPNAHGVAKGGGEFYLVEGRKCPVVLAVDLRGRTGSVCSLHIVNTLTLNILVRVLAQDSIKGRKP